MRKITVMTNHDFQKIRNSIVNFHETKILTQEIYRDGIEMSYACFGIEKNFFVEIDKCGKVFLRKFNKRIFRITGDVGSKWYQYAISIFYNQYGNDIQIETKKIEYKNFVESRIDFKTSKI